MGSPTSFPVLGFGCGPRPPSLSCEVIKRSRFKETTDEASNCQGKLVFSLQNLVCELKAEMEVWKKACTGRVFEDLCSSQEQTR